MCQCYDASLAVDDTTLPETYFQQRHHSGVTRLAVLPTRLHCIFSWDRVRFLGTEYQTSTFIEVHLSPGIYRGSPAHERYSAHAAYVIHVVQLPDFPRLQVAP